MRLFIAAAIGAFGSGAAAQVGSPSEFTPFMNRWTTCVEQALHAAPLTQDAEAATRDAMRRCTHLRAAMDAAVRRHMPSPESAILEIVTRETNRAHDIWRARLRAAAPAPQNAPVQVLPRQLWASRPATDRDAAGIWRTARCNVLPQPDPVPDGCPRWDRLGRSDNQEIFLDRASAHQTSQTTFSIRMRTVPDTAMSYGARSFILSTDFSCVGRHTRTSHSAGYDAQGGLVSERSPQLPPQLDITPGGLAERVLFEFCAL